MLYCIRILGWEDVYMFFRQFLHDSPVVAASYLLGCGSHGLAAVVDPLPDSTPYLETLQKHGLSLRYVIDTHLHADHLSGARRLAEATGVAVVMHDSSPLATPFLPVEDGSQLTLGNVVMEFWHTPGHTPEHVSVLITDKRRGGEPWCVLTGHTLLIGDAGRPDLVAEEGASMLYTSLFKRLLTLPDYVEIYPGAFAGST